MAGPECESGHRFYGGRELEGAAEDVSALLTHVRANAEAFKVDKDRLAIWAFSGGGVFLSLPLRDAVPYGRCLVSYYAVLDQRVPAPGAPNTVSDEVRRAFSPAAYLAAKAGTKLPPILIARAGRDDPYLNAGVDTFLREALAANAPLELLTHPSGRHGFDILDDDARSREIIARTLDFLKTELAH